jgi:hypothetical protein
MVTTSRLRQQTPLLSTTVMIKKTKMNTDTSTMEGTSKPEGMMKRSLSNLKMLLMKRLMMKKWKMTFLQTS